MKFEFNWASALWLFTCPRTSINCCYDLTCSLFSYIVSFRGWNNLSSGEWITLVWTFFSLPSFLQSFRSCVTSVWGGPKNWGLKNRHEFYLSYDVASGNEIMPCNNIDKTLVIYRFLGKVMTSITTLRT